MREVVFNPGALAAGADCNLPAGFKFRRLVKVEVFAAGQYTNAADVAPTEPTIVTSTPSAGQVWLKDEDTLVFGDALTDWQHVRVIGEAIGEQLRVA